MFKFIPLVLALVAQRVAAHGGVIGYGNGGTYYPGWKAYNSPDGKVTIARAYAIFHPIQDLDSAVLSCNIDGSLPGASQSTATVEAGSDVTFLWNQWPHNTDSVVRIPVYPFFYEPHAILALTAYLSRLMPGQHMRQRRLIGLKMVQNRRSRSHFWHSRFRNLGCCSMMTNNNSWTSTIPASVPSGNYLLRHETIALHSLPAQIYPECTQVKIVNGGSCAPTTDELVSFPGGYTTADAGLFVNLYDSSAQSTTTYAIPGPKLYGSGTVSLLTQDYICLPNYFTGLLHRLVVGCPGFFIQLVFCRRRDLVFRCCHDHSSSVVATTASSSVAVVTTASSAAPVTTSAAANSSSTSVAAPATTTSAASTPQSFVSQYGQCGGLNFQGSTTCQSPYVCVKFSVP
ncbi:carbohydrate-binding module family 1 protein [Sphaerobolus stellatus SS14]|uniref:lytic cellulose monooxygenase (C4-dehydrogenating) n=1 Tax=Sphaerobolus stellatus (strain SS14) TaxID=990650 RepID=A0A0C9V7Z6_SPHS4|nr:carbohydrate-binding module family 1 protein [Sphaerobolus stellatus SS14]